MISGTWAPSGSGACCTNVPDANARNYLGGVLLGGQDASDYVYTIQLKPMGRSFRDYGPIFRAVDEDNCYYLGLYTHAVGVRRDGRWAATVARYQGDISRSLVQIRAVGPHVSIFANGRPLVEFDDSTFTHGRVGFRTYTPQDGAFELAQQSLLPPAYVSSGPGSAPPSATNAESPARKAEARATSAAGGSQPGSYAKAPPGQGTPLDTAFVGPESRPPEPTRGPESGTAPPPPAQEPTRQEAERHDQRAAESRVSSEALATSPPPEPAGQTAPVPKPKSEVMLRLEELIEKPEVSARVVRVFQPDPDVPLVWASFRSDMTYSEMRKLVRLMVTEGQKGLASGELTLIADVNGRKIMRGRYRGVSDKVIITDLRQ